MNAPSKLKYNMKDRFTLINFLKFSLLCAWRKDFILDFHSKSLQIYDFTKGKAALFLKRIVCHAFCLSLFLSLSKKFLLTANLWTFSSLLLLMCILFSVYKLELFYKVIRFLRIVFFHMSVVLLNTILIRVIKSVEFLRLFCLFIIITILSLNNTHKTMIFMFDPLSFKNVSSSTFH